MRGKRQPILAQLLFKSMAVKIGFYLINVNNFNFFSFCCPQLVALTCFGRQVNMLVLAIKIQSWSLIHTNLLTMEHRSMGHRELSRQYWISFGARFTLKGKKYHNSNKCLIHWSESVPKFQVCLRCRNDLLFIAWQH